MRDRYLEVTFRKGRVVAAYLYLPRPVGVHSARTEEVAPGLLVDRSAAGTAIGVEITAPRQVTLEAINAVLAQVDQEPVEAQEIAPLQAA